MAVHLFSPEFSPLPFYFVTMDPSYRQEAVHRPMGFVDIGQLLFILSGRGRLQVEGRSYRLSPGMGLFLDRGVPHSYEPEGEMTTAWVTFRGSGMEELRNHIGRRSFLLLEGLPVQKYAGEIDRMQREYYTKKREGVLSSMLYALLISFFEEERQQSLGDMDRVLAYMEEHFYRRLTLDDLAQQVPTSRSTFCMRFRQTFGCTAVERLTEIRLAAAQQRLLAFPDEKIGAVAAKCGFEDAGYFCKVYKKRFGESPLQTKRKSLGRRCAPRDPSSSCI